jgi:nitrogen regulatory protein PII-like uncharacterized protein
LASVCGWHIILLASVRDIDCVGEVEIMKKDVYDYFIQQYEKASFRVVPGHWPDFESKEDVDKWIKMTQDMLNFFGKKYANKHVDDNDDF